MQGTKNVDSDDTKKKMGVQSSSQLDEGTRVSQGSSLYQHPQRETGEQHLSIETKPIQQPVSFHTPDFVLKWTNKDECGKVCVTLTTV